MKLNRIYNEDCLEGMKQMDSDSVDLVVTDPPYGYSFMGKDWDKAVPKVEIWKECLRVLKPGAFCFVMSAPRQDVQSRMIVNLQDAGFEVSFTPLFWAYASGFPKAGNIGKMVDKRMGVESIDLGEHPTINGTGKKWRKNGKEIEYVTKKVRLTAPSTDEAKALDGSYSGFQPKPAVEIILVAMKPLSEKTYVDQALYNGHGITWLDDCRIPYENDGDKWKGGEITGFAKDKFFTNGERTKYNAEINNSGRFPANLLVSDDVLNDGNITRSSIIDGSKLPPTGSKGIFGHYNILNTERGHNDSGSFSRYFDLDKWYINKLPKSVQKTFPFMIVPKAARSEKNEGCEDRVTQKVNDGRNIPPDNAFQRGKTERLNIHPTVKPTKLMSYLITLGSREQDIILDPFMGSGTTAIAARQLSRKFIGFELDKEYHKIAEARIKKHMNQTKLFEY
jgi:DNA modification methylase